MTRMIDHTDEAARHPWPEEVYVQGGKTGIVFVDGGEDYRTAFVEAFPGGTFLRGEGKTLSEAEDSCWTQYQRFVTCDGSGKHGPFERRGYRNGAGFCTKCGTWMNKVFPELPPDPDRKPSKLERLLREMSSRNEGAEGSEKGDSAPE